MLLLVIVICLILVPLSTLVVFACLQAASRGDRIAQNSAIKKHDLIADNTLTNSLNRSNTPKKDGGLT